MTISRNFLSICTTVVFRVRLTCWSSAEVLINDYVGKRTKHIKGSKQNLMILFIVIVHRWNYEMCCFHRRYLVENQVKIGQAQSENRSLERANKAIHNVCIVSMLFLSFQRFYGHLMLSVKVKVKVWLETKGECGTEIVTNAKGHSKRTANDKCVCSCVPLLPANSLFQHVSVCLSVHSIPLNNNEEIPSTQNPTKGNKNGKSSSKMKAKAHNGRRTRTWIANNGRHGLRIEKGKEEGCCDKHTVAHTKFNANEFY